MTTRVSIKVEDSSSGPVTVADRTIEIGQTVTMEVEDGLSISEGPAPDKKALSQEEAMDVFSPANRPNGLMTAGIAPKLPKSGGETAQVQEGSRIVERPVAELGRATQGGGPEADKDGRTPGPQPDNSEKQAMAIAGATRSGAATGDIDAKGKPLAAGETAADAPKHGRAKNAGTSATKKSGKKGR